MSDLSDPIDSCLTMPCTRAAAGCFFGSTYSLRLGDGKRWVGKA